MEKASRTVAYDKQQLAGKAIDATVTAAEVVGAWTSIPLTLIQSAELRRFVMDFLKLVQDTFHLEKEKAWGSSAATPSTDEETATPSPVPTPTPSSTTSSTPTPTADAEKEVVSDDLQPLWPESESR